MITSKDKPGLVEPELSDATAPSIPEPPVEPEPEPEPTAEPEPEPEPEAAVLAVLEPVTGGTVAEPEVILAKKLVGEASLDPVPV